MRSFGSEKEHLKKVIEKGIAWLSPKILWTVVLVLMMHFAISYNHSVWKLLKDIDFLNTK